MAQDARTSLKQLLVVYRYFLPGIVSLGLVLVFGFWAMGMVGQIFDNFDELEEAKRSLSGVEGKLSRLQLLSGGELSGMQRVVGYALPEEKPVFQTLAALRLLANNAQVNIADLSTTPGSIATGSSRLRNVSSKEDKNAKDNTFEEMEVTMEVIGDFESLKTFFDQLLAVSPLMDVKGLRVASRASRNEEDKQEFVGEIDLLVYWMPVDEGKVDVSKETQELSDSQKGVYQRIAGFRAFDLDGNEVNR